MDQPLLLIDVDGVISLFGFDPLRPPAGRFELVDGIAHFLSGSAGECLRGLSAAFELAWCTGWEEKANEYLPLALGLPGPLPHVTFDGHGRPPGAHWKLAAIDSHVGPSRPLAWIDDAHDDRCETWAVARPGPTLLVETEPSEGITQAHVSALRAWAIGLPSRHPPGGPDQLGAITGLDGCIRDGPAFRRSGRDSNTVITGPSRSILTASLSSPPPPGG